MRGRNSYSTILSHLNQSVIIAVMPGPKKRELLAGEEEAYHNGFEAYAEWFTKIWEEENPGAPKTKKIHRKSRDSFDKLKRRRFAAAPAAAPATEPHVPAADAPASSPDPKAADDSFAETEGE